MVKYTYLPTYALLISPYGKILNNVVTATNPNVTFTMINDRSKPEIALKLHKQFSHPPPNKLIRLLNSAGDPWKNDSELKSLINKISDQCNVCTLYKKTPPRPIVGLPMATRFQECVPMDLKFYNNKILLHLVDHATRLSSSIVLPSKDPENIIQGIFKCWIQV